jgi:hypothetical protein
VAFQPASGKESDVEKAQLENVQQRFVNDIGGTQQNPSDPDYQATWTKAQQLADERYRALFGEQAFLNRQQWQNTHPDAADAAN